MVIYSSVKKCYIDRVIKWPLRLDEINLRKTELI